MNDLILYTSDDGQAHMNLRVEGQTVWLTQLEIAELFQTTKNNVSMHTKSIFEEGELAPEATVKESLTVQTEGDRQVQRANRRAAETIEADAEDLRQIEELNNKLKQNKKRPKDGEK